MIIGSINIEKIGKNGMQTFRSMEDAMCKEIIGEWLNPVEFSNWNREIVSSNLTSPTEIKH